MYISAHVSVFINQYLIGCNDHQEKSRSSDDEALAAFCLTLPGKKLLLTPLLSAKKFRNRGKKDDVVRTFYVLEGEGLGKTLVLTGYKGATQVIKVSPNL